METFSPGFPSREDGKDIDSWFWTCGVAGTVIADGSPLNPPHEAFALIENPAQHARLTMATITVRLAGLRFVCFVAYAADAKGPQPDESPIASRAERYHRCQRHRDSGRNSCGSA